MRDESLIRRFNFEDDGSTIAQSGTSGASGLELMSSRLAHVSLILHTIRRQVIIPLADRRRHLICVPYDLENLAVVADYFELKRAWFHKDHYDIPLRRRQEIESRSAQVTSKQIVLVIRGALTYDDVVKEMLLCGKSNL